MATINPIARSLIRPAGSGQVRARPLTSLLLAVMLTRSFAQRNGSVLLRGFIYGSKGVVSSGFNYSKQSRFAIPPFVFVPGDGKYLDNVHIMCARSASWLDLRKNWD